MQIVTCPLCNADFKLPEGSQEGDIVICPICEARLKLVKEGGTLIAIAA